MDLPRPHLWTAGDRPDADSFNDVSDALRFLLDPPQAHIEDTAANNILTSQYNVINFGAMYKDNDGMWNAAANTRLTINTPGWYEVEFGFHLASSLDATRRYYALRLNGDTSVEYGFNEVINSDGTVNTDTNARACYDMFLAVNDYLELAIGQDSGGTLALTATNPRAQNYGTRTFLHVRWIST